MARPSHDRRNADEPDTDLDADLDILDDDADTADDQRDPQTEELWATTRIDPVEISLPTGTGYTLRAYRPPSEVRGPEVDREDDDDPFDELARRRARTDEDDTAAFDELAPDDADDEEVVARAERQARRRRPGHADDESDVDEEFDESDEDDESAEDSDEDADEDEADDSVDEEDVPVFLGHGGKVLLFRTPESLVEFVRSGAPNDLAQLDTWADVVERIRPEDVHAVPDDTYELDLVVENLRGGHDAWDAELLIGAGEVARDLGYALRYEPVLVALSPGSPLDDLDEALRSSVEGGLGGFFARRKLRRIGAQQATLGWRTIIGKISGVVDWRD